MTSLLEIRPHPTSSNIIIHIFVNQMGWNMMEPPARPIRALLGEEQGGPLPGNRINRAPFNGRQAPMQGWGRPTRLVLKVHASWQLAKPTHTVLKVRRDLANLGNMSQSDKVLIMFLSITQGCPSSISYCSYCTERDWASGFLCSSLVEWQSVACFGFKPISRSKEKLEPGRQWNEIWPPRPNTYKQGLRFFGQPSCWMAMVHHGVSSLRVPFLGSWELLESGLCTEEE